MIMVEALLTDALSPKQKALGAATLTNTNSVFLYSLKRPAPKLRIPFSHPEGVHLRELLL